MSKSPTQDAVMDPHALLDRDSEYRLVRVEVVFNGYLDGPELSAYGSLAPSYIEVPFAYELPLDAAKLLLGSEVEYHGQTLTVVMVDIHELDHTPVGHIDLSDAPPYEPLADKSAASGTRRQN